ncbi:MAG: hypothetical protein HYR56_05720 [Acidobacteria bacterium]|nr:hypothetical protein [Acidobacteriota bacterium]MBI3423494.1 hypothetical protein [Acidobacteriota bacterium]
MTKVKFPNKHRGQVKGGSKGVAVGNHQTQPRNFAPLNITLLSLDGHNRQLGDGIIYDVALKNVTKDILVIPWSPDWSKVKPNEEKYPPGYLVLHQAENEGCRAGFNPALHPGCALSIHHLQLDGVLDAFLSLVIKDEISGDQLVAGQALYGSQLLPNSLKKLRPGQSVRIRTPGILWFTDSDVTKRVLAKLPHMFEVQAYFNLSNPALALPYEPAVSTNRLTLDLKRRQ